MKKEMFTKEEKKKIKKNVLLLLLVFVALLFLTEVNALSNASLVNYWSFDKNATDDILNLGTTDTTTNTSGILGSARKFVGSSSQYIAWTNNAGLNVQTFTINYWVSLNTSSGNLAGFWKGTDTSSYYNWVYSGSSCDFSTPGTSPSIQQSYYTPTLNVWRMMTYVIDNTTKYKYTYIDGVLKNTTSFTGSVGVNTNGLNFGKYTTNYFSGSLDELSFWNKALNSSEISELYNNGSAYNPITPITVTPVPVFINQTPSNIDSLNAAGNGVVVYYNYSGVNSTNAKIEYAHLGMNEIINGTIQPTYNNHTYSNITGDVVKFVFDDNDVYGYTANVDDENMSNTPHGYYTITGINDVLKVELINISNNLSFNILEVMINSTNNINLFYCNSSYSIGVPGVNSNCALFSTGTYPLFNHTVNNSRHNVFNLPIISNKVNNVTVTSTSYIVIRPLVLQTAQLGYINGSVRNNLFQISGNGGISYTSDNTKIPDLHIHQYSGSSTENFTYRAHDSQGNYSIYQVDSIGVSPLPPTSPTVNEPTSKSITWGDSVNITWSPASVGNNLTRITGYNVSVVDSNFNVVKFIGNYSNSTFNVSNFNNFTGLVGGLYYIEVKAVDNISQTSKGYSGVLTLGSTLLSPCNETLTLNSTGKDILFNWTTDTSIINSTLYGSKNIFTNVTLTNVTGVKSINYSLTNGSYELYLTQTYNDSSVFLYDTNCYLNICVSSWTRTTEQCVDNLRLINYTDTNSCSEEYNKPSDTGLFEDCTLPPDTDRELWFIILLIVLWIICVVLALMYSPIIIFIGWLTSVGIWFYANSYFGNIYFGLLISIITVMLTVVVIGLKK